MDNQNTQRKNRPGQGRKHGTGDYGEPTEVIRVPKSLKPSIVSQLDAYKLGLKLPTLDPSRFTKASLNPFEVELPVYSGRVSAGQSRFPSPAQDYELETLDLNKKFITNPPATYLFRVSGDSMKDAGILDGATAIVNAAIEAKSSNIVVAAVDGEWVVKRLYKRGKVIKLLSENEAYPPIVFAEGQELIIFGVVTHVINEAK